MLVELRSDSCVRWLQAIDTPEIGFAVVDARLVLADFPVDELRRSLDYCDLEADEDVVPLAICCAPFSDEPPTINLEAPIGLGLRSRRGGQVLLRKTTLTMAMRLGPGCSLLHGEHRAI